MTKSKRKGFTLAELGVVLAVLAVVAGMVVTFVLMAGSSNKVSSARLDAMQDIRVAEAIIEGFVSSNDVSVTGKDGEKEEYTTLTKKNTENENKSLYFDTDEKKLIIENGGNTESSLELKNVKSIRFSVVTKETNVTEGGTNNTESETDKIYYCYIQYEVAGKTYNYNFCVNPVVGERVTQSVNSVSDETNSEGGASDDN